MYGSVSNKFDLNSLKITMQQVPAINRRHLFFLEEKNEYYRVVKRGKCLERFPAI